MSSPKDKNDSKDLSEDLKDDSKGSNDEIETSGSPASSNKPDVSFEELCNVTPPDNETLDSSALGDTSTSEKDTFFKWLSKSPQMIFKSFKNTREIVRKPKSRPRCSSAIEAESIRNSSCFEKLSPIQKEKSPMKDMTSNFKSLFSKVDRIDYANIADDRMIPTFLSSRTCYDLMPTSGKVVVLSSELLVKNAFEALVNNELRAAPLWNTALSSFVGMLTISDFINILRHYYRNSPENITNIESQTIATWKKMNKIQRNVTVMVNAMNHLAHATKVLIEEGVHRIPVLDEARQCVLFVLTRKRLLHYIYYNLIEKFGKSIPKTPSFLNQSIRELGVGTFEDIATVTYKTTVAEALDLFMQRKVSALPIVDENNAVLDIFAKFDVFALAKEQSYHNLDITIEEAIEKGKAFVKVHEDVYGISLDDTLGTVIQSIVTSKAHRLVVIDEKKVPIGMVSLSDILKYIVVQPLAVMDEQSSAAADTIEEAPEGAVGGSENDGGSENEDVFLNAKLKSADDLESTADAQESVAEEEDPAKSKEDTSVEAENAPE